MMGEGGRPRVRVRLWDHVGTGLVLEGPTGVVYTQQVGGVRCLHPQVEGLFVPLGNDLDENGCLLGPQERLDTLFSGHGAHVDEALADRLDAVFREPRWGVELRVDRSRLAESWEAWVAVRVEGGADLVTGWPMPCGGFLTWCNSD